MQFKASLTFRIVEVKREFTASTDSMFDILIPSGLEASIWKATVSNEPPNLSISELLNASKAAFGSPSAEMTKPDGRTGSIEESSPFMAEFIAATSVGAYTTYDPMGVVKLS